ncbi:permease prefix domain 1-containing protein [Alkalibacillus salilacus]|uniref:Cation transport ATPase n=1 Tax=Alkalibacillus salilacus TaxID=284582 RepID=A0ABT9VED3_9BACI|nr:permease prefix domain 1-containing protein [Alkalibacillus salilacus]MDQ0159327.1 cation transport ATPase [Alkalibacillus salilacus]
MNLNRDVQQYVDDLFKGVSESQQLFDLKQELITNMHARISDYQKQGMSDEEAFQEAKASMGDMSGLVEDMRQHGADESKQTVYTSMTNRMAVGALVIGSMLIVFGLLMSVSMMFMEVEPVAVPGAGIFAVIGGVFLTYGILTRETKTMYAMQRLRAALYAVAVGFMLFAIFTAVISGLATGELFIGFSAFTVFFVIGFGLWLSLLLMTRVSRRK